MKKDSPRVYADTSVFGGMFDDEFAEASEAFFNMVRFGAFSLVVSDLVRRELTMAPQAVIELWDGILVSAEIAPISEEALILQKAYLQAGVLSPTAAMDALHVALAVVHHCDILVSWNFRHIVHYEKIDRYNAVNTLQGFGRIAIYSPLEVVSYEGEEEGF